MNFLIIDDEKYFHNIINNVISTDDFNNVIFLESGLFSFEDISFNFSNLLDLLEKLEKENLAIDTLTIVGGVLNYSSELNVRTILSSLINLPIKVFSYFEKANNIKSKHSTLNRSFHALGVNPKVNLIDKTTIEIRVESDNSWENFSLGLMKETVTEKLVTTSSLVDELEVLVSQKKPTSLIRLNHCENRLLGFGYTFDKKEADITYDIQFGYVLDEINTNYISMRMRDAVKNADIIGTPAFSRNSSNKLNILENSTYIHLNSLSLYNNQTFTNVNCHYVLGKSLKFKSIITSCDNLIAITCRDMSKLKSVLSREVNVIKIPEENRFLTSSITNGIHYPERFYEIENEIKNTVQEGCVVLVGAGILGKIYCSMVKKAGGIAIDVGSLMDAIADVDSRGSGFKKAGFWWE